MIEELTGETPEARWLSDIAWLRATNGGEAQGYPPIVRRLLAAYDAALAHAATETADCIRLRTERDAALARATLQEELKVIALRGEQDALARAKAAELESGQRLEMAKYRGDQLSMQFRRALAAESRLSEANALLERCRDATEWHHIPQRELCALLSATPAPSGAAPHDPDALSWPVPCRVVPRVPEHIYDANDRPVCTMPTGAVASRVVRAVNAAPAATAPHAGTGAGGGDDKDYDDWRDEAIAEGRAKLRAEKKCRAVEAILGTAQPHAIPGTVSADAFERALAVLSGESAPAATAESEEPEEDTESLIEQLDEALCSLLHTGGELGEHSPRTHLDLFYAHPEHPDTIALSECRAELDRFRTNRGILLEQLSDAGDAEATARAERDTARGELAKLSADYGTLLAESNANEVALTASRALVERIEAELKSARSPNVHAKVDRALALIRTNKAGGA